MYNFWTNIITSSTKGLNKPFSNNKMIGTTVVNVYKYFTSDEESIEDGKSKTKQLTSSVLHGTTNNPFMIHESS